MSEQHIHILVVEDDINLRETLDDILSDLYQVSTSDCIARAQQEVQHNTFDLIILDLMLPDGDGYSFCQTLRTHGISTPVLMLTARSLEDDLVKGFEAGADDYLVKPYRTNELHARVKALLRRRGNDNTSKDNLTNGAVEIGEYSLSRSARTITTKDARVIDLTPKEFDLLVYLYDHPHQAISRYKLLEAVWDNTVIDERTVDNFVSSLKRKLNLSAGSTANIETVRGVGYRFEIK